MTQLDFHDLFAESRSSPANLAEAAAYYDDAASDHPRRSAIRSSFKMMGRGLRLPLDQVSADPVRLREQLKSGGPAYAGVTPAAWKTGKSLAICALRKLNVDIAPLRDNTQIGPAWQVLLDQAPDRKRQIGIARFLRFLTRTGVEPVDLSTSHFEAWREELVNKSVKAGPETSYRQLLRHWKACGNAVAGWPLGDIASCADPRRYSLDWEQFPASFKAEVEGYLASRLKPDPFAANAPKAIRADTASGRRNLLRSIASALVLSGDAAASDVVGLSVLTDIENVRSALRFLRDKRAGEKFTPQHLNMADLRRGIAKHVEGNQDKADAIRALLKVMTNQVGDQKGIKPKNRDRLAQFDDAKNIERLALLPRRTLRAAEKGPLSHRAATRVMYALQIGLLLVVPMRLKNLTELKYGENLLEVGTGKARHFRIFLSKAQTKTYMDYVAPLPAYLYPLIDAWRATYRPKTCDHASPYVFPNGSGALRSRDSLSSKWKGFIQRETGVIVNVHLFRHLAAKIYLAHNPEG